MESRKRARAKFDLQKPNEGKFIGFAKGDILVLTNTTGEKWWWGHLEKEPTSAGWVPPAYLELLDGAAPAEPKEESHFVAEAKYNLATSKGANYITFEKGDRLLVTKHDKPDWWWAYLGKDLSKKGWIPAAYVRTLDTCSEQETQAFDIIARTEKGEVVKKEEPEAVRMEKPKPTTFVATVVEAKYNLASQQKPPYLSFAKGEVFYVTNQDKKEWWWGVSLKDPLRKGWLPANYVVVLRQEEVPTSEDGTLLIGPLAPRDGASQNENAEEENRKRAEEDKRRKEDEERKLQELEKQHQEEDERRKQIEAEEAARRQQEEEERLRKEEEERQRKEAEERLRKEEEERQRKAEEERKRKEEEERRLKEDEERKRKEDEERRHKEETERLQREAERLEAERQAEVKRLEDERQEKLRKEEEQRKAEEERKRLEEEQQKKAEEEKKRLQEEQEKKQAADKLKEEEKKKKEEEKKKKHAEKYVRCIANYNYTAKDNNHLSLAKGDMLVLLAKGSGKADGWWQGYLEKDGDKKKGWFPGNYVQEIRTPDSVATSGLVSPTSAGSALPTSERSMTAVAPSTAASAAPASAAAAPASAAAAAPASAAPASAAAAPAAFAPASSAVQAAAAGVAALAAAAAAAAAAQAAQAAPSAPASRPAPSLTVSPTSPAAPSSSSAPIAPMSPTGPAPIELASPTNSERSSAKSVAPGNAPSLAMSPRSMSMAPAPKKGEPGTMKYEYQGKGEGYLTVKKGEPVSITAKKGDWWFAALDSDKTKKGWVPATYVTLADDPNKKEEKPEKDLAINVTSNANGPAPASILASPTAAGQKKTVAFGGEEEKKEKVPIVKEKKLAAKSQDQIMVTVKYAFQAKLAHHLSVSKGDRLILLQKGSGSSEGWWQGALESAPGKEGWFPANYVEEDPPFEKEPKSPEIKEEKEPRKEPPAIRGSEAGKIYESEYEYQSTKQGSYLSFPAGVKIIVTQRKPDWWFGKILGEEHKKGWFPATYVKEIPVGDDDDDPPPPPPPDEEAVSDPDIAELKKGLVMTRYKKGKAKKETVLLHSGKLVWVDEKGKGGSVPLDEHVEATRESQSAKEGLGITIKCGDKSLDLEAPNKSTRDLLLRALKKSGCNV